MNGNKTYINRFKGYFMEDCECQWCRNFQGEKKGCKIPKCCCEGEKGEAIANGRIKRRRGSMAWDG